MTETATPNDGPEFGVRSEPSIAEEDHSAHRFTERKVLSEADWQAKATAHRERTAPWVTPRLERRKHGEAHPVDDFLFQYYKYRPRQLSTWHPGWKFALEKPSETYLEHPDYRVPQQSDYSEAIAGVDPSRFGRRRSRVERAVQLLAATSANTARFGCFGMHEWAMVYGQQQSEVRHERLPLRLSPENIQRTVDSIGLRCTHFDAYRFFTDRALPMQQTLTRDSQSVHEQGGCLHTGMDLYRYAYEAGPFIPSEITADCFENARTARRLDMQASPYDVSSLGLQTIAVETAEGRANYADEQRKLADQSRKLRHDLLQTLGALLTAQTVA